MNTAAPKKGPVVDEHMKLRQLLGRVDNASSREALVESLESLLALLERHFAFEEGPRGLHRLVTDLAPELEHRVADIFDEHRLIGACLRRTLSRARDVRDESLTGLRVQARAITEDLRDHEHRETELLRQATEASRAGAPAAHAQSQTGRARSGS